MGTENNIRAFREWTDRLSAFQLGLTMIGLDQDTAPKAGAAYRTEKRAILTAEYRKLLQDEKMFDILQELEGTGTGDETMDAEVRLYLKRLRRERSVPIEAYVAFEKAKGASSRIWHEARAQENYQILVPALQNLIDVWREVVSHWDSPLPLYDRMLDQHQPGWTSRQYDAFFDAVRDRLIPLLQKIQKSPAPNESFLHEFYPAEKQRLVMPKVCELLGYTSDWGQLSESAHPLTTCVCQGDVRFSTKYRENDISQAILSTTHESGHAWFGHQVDPAYEGSIIAHSISAGLHESQSRLVENHIGRSLAFWEIVLPWLKEVFPDQLEGVTDEQFALAVNAVHPSLVRTEADEVTYPLHIMIRYDMEKQFLGGDLKAKDLEEVWNEQYKAVLGLTPDRPTHGILQDLHWPYAYFGYFPTYALGSAMAAQFYAALSRDLDVPSLLKAHQFPHIMAWLRDHVHRYGGLYLAEEVLQKATGEPFNPEYYLAHLEKR